jgi:hypothetical protein
MRELVGTQPKRQVGAEPRGPLLHIELMVFIGELQLRIQGMPTTPAGIAVEVQAIQ